MCTIINLNVARALNIGVVSLLCNCQRSPRSKLGGKTQFVMWFAGLRGAMAYALALQASTTLEMGPVILVTTLVYSLITVLGLGSVLHPVLTWADVMRKPEQGEQEPTKNCSNSLKSSLSTFDTNYFAPLFIRNKRDIEDRNFGRSDSFAGSDILSQEMA